MPLSGIIKNMQRVFKTRHFSRWMRKTELTDSLLCEAVTEMVNGLIDADLGAGIVKKRISMPGRGKSSGARTLIATNRGSRWFFVYGFEKNDRTNIDADELVMVQGAAGELLAMQASQLELALLDRSLMEICHEN